MLELMSDNPFFKAAVEDAAKDLGRLEESLRTIMKTKIFSAFDRIFEASEAQQRIQEEKKYKESLQEKIK